MNLDSDALLRRSKELDAQEDYLASIKEKIEQGPMTIKVYEARIKAKQTQLDTLESEVSKAEQSLKDLNEVTGKDKIRHDGLKQDYAKELRELEGKKSSLLNQLTSVKNDIRDSQVEYEERLKYSEALEEQIEKLSEEGNTKLLDLNNDIAKLSHEIEVLSKEKLDLRNEVDDLIISTGELQDSFNIRKEELDNQINQSESRLKEIQSDIVKETQRYRGIESDVNEKLSILKTREESYIAKRDALRLEKQELEQDKRRWESSKSLYGDI